MGHQATKQTRSSNTYKPTLETESNKETGHNVFFKSDFSGAGIGFDAVLV